MALEELPEVFADEERTFDAAFADHRVEEIARLDEANFHVMHLPLSRLERAGCLERVSSGMCPIVPQAILEDEVILFLELV